MSDEKAMVAAHKSGQQLYCNEASPNTTITVTQLAIVTYQTADERIAFISGYFGAKKRAAMKGGTTP
jgi:hypothetical protein